MFPAHSTFGAGQPRGDETNFKRRRSSISSDTDAKRPRAAGSFQSGNPSSEALKHPGASCQSENQHDSITDSPSDSSFIEDASFTSNTSVSTPSRCSSSNPTHDTSLTSFHIKDLATFAATLEEAASSAFPNRGRSRYAKVNVCLIRWEEDEAVQPELQRLSDVFEHGYRFKVENWTIPTETSHIKLMGQALSFINDFDAIDNLFVVYYAGHGTINENRQPVWCCTRDPKYASVDWSSIQSLFDHAISDVLVLLDCCAAASSINTSGNGVNETIAACGFEGIAPPPGPHSFTNTLTEVLEDWKDRPCFSVSLLHSEILFQLKRKRPEKGREGKRIPGWCSTPVHYISSSDPRPQSIELCRAQVQDEQSIHVESPPYSPRLFSGLPQSTLQENQTTSRTSTTPNGDITVPHVLISVALEEEQADLNLESWRRWLARPPALVKYAKVQGVFRSYSTLLLLSIPVVIWNMLPENKACSFVSFIFSENLAFTMLNRDEQVAAQSVPTVAPEKSIPRALQQGYQPSDWQTFLDLASSLHTTRTSLPAENSQVPKHGSSWGFHVPTSVPKATAVPSFLPAPTDNLLPWGFNGPSPVPRESLGEPMSLTKWYLGNETPCIPKMHSSSHENHRTAPTAYIAPRALRQPGRFDVPSSDSGYGTRRSLSPPNSTERDHEKYSSFANFDEPQIQVSQENSTWLRTAPSIPGSETLVCPTCRQEVKTQSELKKHFFWHTKPFECTVAGCPRTEGFSTANDLERHKRSKHPEITIERRFRCHVDGCKSKEKSWPRLDNFRSHLRRVHGNQLRNADEFDDMIRRSEVSKTLSRGSDSIQNIQGNEFSQEAMNSGAAKSIEDDNPPEKMTKETDANQPSWLDVAQSRIEPSPIIDPTLAVIKAALEAGASLERDLHSQTALNEDEKIANGADNDIQPEDDVHTRDVDAQKKVLEVLKGIHELGYTIQKDLSSSRPINLESAVGNRKEIQVTCHVCKKFTCRPCELKKHMKRHERPYGCTFVTCNKLFGSKKDWKRHECSQHYQVEMWRCDEERLEGGSCAKVCVCRQTFIEHLVEAHKMSDRSAITSKADKCRIGRNTQTRFWCGFCTKLVDMKSRGLDAWTERFDHIDDHFMGRGVHPKQSIIDWVPLNSDRPKGEVGSPDSSDSPSSRGRTQSPHSPGSPNKGSRPQSPCSLGSPTELSCSA